MDGNQPTGLRIQPRSGFLHWTPTADQVGNFTVMVSRRSDGTTDTINLQFQVEDSGQPAPVGLYVAPNGDDGAAGTFDQPLASLHEVSKRVLEDPSIVTVFLRGGTYTNEGFGDADFSSRRGNLARFNAVVRSSQAPLTIRSHGNEYPLLISDVNGLVINDSENIRLQGLELQGLNPSLNEQNSLALWWETGTAANQILGRGIALNGSYEIDIVDCIVHDFPGAGISNNNGADIRISDSLIYDNTWWSYSGSHGIANSKPVSRDADPDRFKIRFERNLVWGNQSSMISHVFSKGVVKMEIDEGNGLHMQNNAGEFVGRMLAEGNLVLYNGKAGLGLNTIDGSRIVNNSFYQNAQAVRSVGELSIQSSSSQDISANLLHARPDRVSVKDFQHAFTGVGNNYAVATDNEDPQMPDSVMFVDQVYSDPQSLNFSADDALPAGQGVPSEVLAGFREKLTEFGLLPAPAPTVITETYIEELREAIFSSWPAPGSNPDIPNQLELEVDGICYEYADRADYPDPPSVSNGVCP